MATQTQDAGQAVVETAKVGMPQLDFSTFSNQIFWLVVTLVVIYFILSRIALPRIGGALADRAGTITNDLAEAAALAEIRNSAMVSVKDVAKATAKEIVAVMGGKADAKTVTTAVTARMKG